MAHGQFMVGEWLVENWVRVDSWLGEMVRNGFVDDES